MSSNNTPVFRSSMGGFNKKDVTDYIAKLNLEFSETLEEKDESIKKLKKELAEAHSAVDEQNELSNEQANEELDKANSLISAQNEQIEVLNEKITTLEAELAKAVSRLESESAKAAQYDSVTCRMGEIFVEASNDADRIRSQAKKTADELIAVTEADCKEKCEKVEAYLVNASKSRSEEISKLLADAQKAITDILRDFEMKATTISTVTADDCFRSEE